MYSGKIVFSQIMDFLPMYEFQKCIQRYQGNYKTRTFTCLDQFLCMAFAQLTYRESLRDIEACLRSMQNKLYHLGFRGKISRSTLAHSNDTRDWRIYADFAQILISTARKLYVNEPFSLDLKQTVYALDATTIKLCLSLFPWSHFRLNQGAIKLHTLMDIRGSIPSFIKITPAKVQEVMAAAGPGVNFLMALAWALFFGIASGSLLASGGLQFMSLIGVSINIALMVLNLLPILPLDGGRIAVSLLPHSLAVPYARTERFGFVIVIALLMTGVLGVAMRPLINAATSLVEALTGINLPGGF